MYLFPKIDMARYNFKDDNDFAYRLLNEKQVLIVPGSGFNHTDNAHFRIVFLPNVDQLAQAAGLIRVFFEENSF